MTEHEHDQPTSWATGVTLRRSTSGPLWTISVGADGTDHTEELTSAIEQALAAWQALEVATTGLRPPVRK